jgi:hypothetical protein
MGERVVSVKGIASVRAERDELSVPRPLSAGSRAIVCAPCNKAKGSLSLQRFANRLARAGDPRALRVAAFLEIRSFTFHS